MLNTPLLRAAAAACTATTAKPLTASVARHPIVWTYLPKHLPYALGLLLQETLVHSRLDAKRRLADEASTASTAEAQRLKRIAETDVLLLLQHTPVFTAGRREKDPVVAAAEAKRLGQLGADYVSTMRGGQTTYHGPGQLVGYSIMDLAAADLSTRCYVGHLETFLKRLSTNLEVPVYPLDHTGVFTSPTSKIGSIGIHIRRRVSLHGFSLNVEEQTRKWFDAIVACGLEDVKSTSVEAVRRDSGSTETTVAVKDVVPLAVKEFGIQYGREMKELKDGDEHAELWGTIADGVAGKLPPLEEKQLL